MLLLKLLDLTYRPGGDDDAERPIKTTANALAKAARVRDRQFRNILEQLTADGILLDMERVHNHITCRIDYAPLMKLADYGQMKKEEKQEHNDDRAAAAREARKQERLYQEGLALNAQLRNILNDALLDYLSKGGTLNPEQQAMLRECRELRKKADEYGRNLK
jgi:hypothetical protein